MSDTVETIELTTADMLEIVASGGNGVEYVDVPSLLEQAAQELRALRAENERLKAAEIAGREVLLPAKREQVQRVVQEATRLLRAENERLRTALKPFGDFADCYDEAVTVRRHADNEPIYTRESHVIGKREMTIGDCRRARRAMERKPE